MAGNQKGTRQGFDEDRAHACIANRRALNSWKCNLLLVQTYRGPNSTHNIILHSYTADVLIFTRRLTRKNRWELLSSESTCKYYIYDAYCASFLLKTVLKMRLLLFITNEFSSCRSIRHLLILLHPHNFFNEVILYSPLGIEYSILSICGEWMMNTMYCRLKTYKIEKLTKVFTPTSNNLLLLLHEHY